jgi:hypothetical protein
VPPFMTSTGVGWTPPHARYHLPDLERSSFSRTSTSTAVPRGTAVLFSIGLNTRSYEGIPLYEGITDMDLTRTPTVKKGFTRNCSRSATNVADL